MLKIINGDTPVSRIEVLDFEAQGKRVLDAAREEARKIIAASRREAEIMRHNAHEEAYAAGLKEGGEAGLQEGRKEGARRAEEEFEARSQELTTVLEGILSEFASRREQMLEQIRSEALEFLLMSVERIVRSEVAIDREAVRRALEQGLELVTSAPVRVQVSSIDLEYLRRILPEIMAERPVEGVAVEAAEDLKDGDVRLVHPEGTVDLSLEAQLNVLRAAFVGGGNGAV